MTTGSLYDGSTPFPQMVCVSGSCPTDYWKRFTPEPVKQKDEGVQEFFEKLGYKVTWDRNRNGCWFELHDDGLVAQVDMGVPLNVIIEDMVAWHLGKEPEDRPDKPDWVCSGEQGPEMTELFRRVYNFKTFNQMPDGQINLGI